MRLMQMRFFDVQGPTYFQRYLVLAMHGHGLIVLCPGETELLQVFLMLLSKICRSNYLPIRIKVDNT